MTNVKKDYQKILGSVQKPVKGEAGKTGVAFTTGGLWAG